MDEIMFGLVATERHPTCHIVAKAGTHNLQKSPDLDLPRTVAVVPVSFAVVPVRLEDIDADPDQEVYEYRIGDQREGG